MIYAYDTEFLEDGKTIDLISIGIVCEDGREYYAVNRDAPWKRIRKHDWLMANVVPSLPQPHGDWINQMPKSWPIDFQSPLVKTRQRIAREVRDFLLGGQSLPELWADYCAYDHVVLAQLYGPMVNLPEGLPMFTHDLQQEVARTGVTLPPQKDGVHNALADARHVMECLRHLGVAEPRA